MPAGPMSQDLAYYDDPLKFNGYRFYHPASGEHEKTGNEYSAIEPGNLSWGNGRFSCPGRWYASLMMKLLIASLILEYDFKFPEDTRRRPSNFVMDVHVLPNMSQKLLIRGRS